MKILVKEEIQIELHFEFEKYYQLLIWQIKRLILF